MSAADTLQLLITSFKSFHSSGEYVSLKVWTDEENVVRFYFTNNPLPKKQTVSDVSKNPANCHSDRTIQPSPVIETRSKKRKISNPKISNSKTPESARDNMFGHNILNVSQIETETDRTQPTIPCTNRFTLLQELINGPTPPHDKKNCCDGENDDNGDNNDCDYDGDVCVIDSKDEDDNCDDIADELKGDERDGDSSMKFRKCRWSDCENRVSFSYHTTCQTCYLTPGRGLCYSK